MAIVRRFKVEDLGRVMDICEVSFEERYTAEFFLSCFEANFDHFLVAEEGDVVGVVLGIGYFNSLGRILILAVDRGFRRRGIGKALIEAVLKSYMASGISEIRLEARVSNRIALALYGKFGFKIAGRTRNYYIDGEDALLLSKSLPSVSVLD